MAVNMSRSMNYDLRLGAVEGSYRSATPDRGGEPETTTVAKRASLAYENWGNQGPLASLDNGTRPDAAEVFPPQF